MLVDQIREDMKVAMKAKDDLRLQTLRGTLAAFTNELISKSMRPTDSVPDTMAVLVVKRLAKQRKDAAEQFAKGGRPDLAEKETAELHILEEYLPQSASKDDIEKVAKIKIAEFGITDASGIGKLTGAIMKEFSGNADGNDVREVLQKLLN
jgi:uncharacterized protein YqeY